MSIDGHHTSTSEASGTWLTPAAILAALGRFALDPCAAPSPRSWATADIHVELPTDGLAVDWVGRVWLNPPYGREMGPWLEKLANHGNGVACIFARTETDDWHEHVWPKASGILFIRGRINFYFPDGSRAKKNAGAPSVLVAYGASNVEALAQSGITGHLSRLR
jgi:DNA N-6-adenine-methyltransferase (Dam)